MNKSLKLIIPENFYQCYRNRFELTDFVKKNPALLVSTMKNPNAEYIINANKSGKKHFKQLSIARDTISKFNSAESLTMSFANIDLLNVVFNPTYSDDPEYFWTDKICSKNFSISTDNCLTFEIINYRNSLNSFNTKNITLSAPIYKVNIMNQENIESIILNKSSTMPEDTSKIKWEHRPHFRIKNLKNLKLLNLSGLNNLPISDFNLLKLPEDCKLIFREDFTFDQYYYNKPYSSIKLNDITGTEKTIKESASNYSYDRSPAEKVQIIDICPNIKPVNGKIEISFKDYAEAIFKYSKKEIQNEYELEEKHLKENNTVSPVSKIDIYSKKPKQSIVISNSNITKEYSPYEYVMHVDNKLNVYNDPNIEYILNLSLPPQPRTGDIRTGRDVFENLNIKGDLTIKTQDYIRTATFDFTDYNKSLDDQIPEGNIKFLADAALSLTCQPKEMINGPKSIYSWAHSNRIRLANLLNTREIIIPNHNTNEIVDCYSSSNDNLITLYNLPNLQKLDLTGYANFKYTHLRLQKIPENCEIILNPTCYIQYPNDWTECFKTPLLSSLLNYSPYRQPDNKIFSFSSVFNPAKDGKIHCTYKEFAQAIRQQSLKEFNNSKEISMKKNHLLLENNKLKQQSILNEIKK